ncbi:MAG: ABC transporter permease [Candidatus Aminicenantes bacterium]|nr:ABC transporter permease [Candidatus Aminicenantes bacterium]
MTLLLSYVKSAVRHYKKGPLYFLIIVLGLILGITCFLTAVLSARYERSYDLFHANSGSIFRVYSQSGASEGGPQLRTTTPFPLAETLKREYPEVDRAVSVGDFASQETTLKWGDRRLRARGISATPGFFELFSFPLLKGDPAGVLSLPDSVVLSQSLAERIFGSADPLGEQVVLDKDQVLQVTGILRDVPPNSHLHFEYVVSLHKKNDAIGRFYLGWDFNFVMTYVALSSPKEAASLEKKMSSLGRLYLPDIRKNTVFRLQPLAAIHLYPLWSIDPIDAGDARQVNLMLLIGGLVLAIACINAVNLIAARASLRLREIGLRKMHGAGRGQLILQLMVESFIISLCALMVAALLVTSVVPSLGHLAGLKISFGMPGQALLGFLFLGTAAIVAVASGLYPALVLSSSRISDIMEGRASKGSPRSRLRAVLVVSQFAAVGVFLVSAFTVSQQLRFIQNKPLGFEKEHIVTMKVSDAKGLGNVSEFAQALSGNTLIGGISLSMPPARIDASTTASLSGNKNEAFPIQRTFVDYNFLEFFDMKLSAGRFYSAAFPSDETQKRIVLNEAAARSLGGAGIIGRRIFLSTSRGDQIEHEVIGIVKDFHFQPLHKPISPLALSLVPEGLTNILCAKIGASDVPGALALIRKTYARFGDPEGLAITFLDEAIEALYAGEREFRNAVRIFSVLSILIAGFGLFGLAAHATERRTKEIGVRKVLGASIRSVVVLLNGEFLLWVLWANLISWPVGYYLMDHWLRGFAYRTAFPLWILPVTSAISVVGAMLTVGGYSYSVAMRNPVEAIRYE